MNVFILCAGEGRRLQPYTLKNPKPAIPFMSVPLAYYSLALIDHLKFKNLVVNTFHLPEQVSILFNNSIFKGAKSVNVSNESFLLGSAGGINQAYQYLKNDDHFMMMNGDEVILPKNFGVIDRLIQEHIAYKPIATILTAEHQEVGGKFGGIWTDGNSQVEEISKKEPSPGLKGEHFLGVMILDKRIKDFLSNEIVEENIFYPILNNAIKAGEKVRTYKIETEWFETGNTDDFLKASETCASVILNKSSDYWVEHLKQVISYYGGVDGLIEKDHPLLNDLVTKAVKTIRG